LEELDVTDKQLVVAEPQPPQQIITIEPEKYVALVFEPFRKLLDTLKAEADKVTYDITTTAGMKTAIEMRAKFRDQIRLPTEAARKERKAPILEIGRLLDSRAKEIEAEVAPYESRFDGDIKAEEARKKAEKAAKLAAERQRVNDIRTQIDVIRSKPAMYIGKPSADIGVTADHLSEMVISLGQFAEFAGEAQAERDHAVKQLREMQEKQLASEQEQERIKAEREALAKERAEVAERERKAAAEREAQAKKDREALEARQAVIAEQERRAKEARIAEEGRMAAEQLAAQKRADEAARTEREAAARTQAAMSEIQGIQQQVMIAVMGRSGVRKGGTIQCIRDTLAETEAWAIDDRFGVLQGAAEMAKQTAVAEIRRLLTEAEAKEAAEAAARAEAERIASEQAAAAQAEADRIFAEQQRIEADRQAAEIEAIRREAEQFELNGPEPSEILRTLADQYDVSTEVALAWLCRHVWAEVEAIA
jgi:hypothetical protein